MKTNEKKVIFLNRVSSPYIEQAIFVLKENSDCSQASNGIVKEAERIVAEFAKEYLEDSSAEKMLEEDETDCHENTFSYCEDIPSSEMPTFEFLKQKKKSKLVSFVKRNFLKVFLTMVILGSVGALIFLATQAIL